MPKAPKKADLIKLMTDENVEHHLFSCSGSSQWLACGMSVWEQFGIPDVETDAAAEGTQAHGLAEIALMSQVDNPLDPLAETYGIEMCYFVNEYVKYVDKVLGANSRRWIEQRINVGNYILGGYGTADVVGYTQENDIHIIDLKYGKGVQVFAKDNPQLKLYALGVLDAMYRADKPVRNIWVHIAQPRLFHYEAFRLEDTDLWEFGEYVKQWVDRCLDKDVDYNPSQRACQWCKAQATCTALYEHNLSVITDDFEDLSPPAPEALTLDELRRVMDNKKLIETWLKGIEAHIFQRIERGEKFPGYKMVEGRSQRRYGDNAEEVLEKILGENAFEKKLITITAAEKAIGKKQFTELGITVKPDGKPTLAPESDKREALPQFSDNFEMLKAEKE
jgi:hypothetical protein